LVIVKASVNPSRFSKVMSEILHNPGRRLAPLTGAPLRHAIQWSGNEAIPDIEELV
jgi:hypothetical protein